MKKDIYILILLSLLTMGMMCSCSSGSEEEPVEFAASKIILTPQFEDKFGCCQLHNASVDVEEEGVEYYWEMYCVSMHDDMTDTWKRFIWFPQRTGKYQITCVLKKGEAEKTLSVEQDVVACTYGFGFYGQTEADIMSNEIEYARINSYSEPVSSHNIEEHNGERMLVATYKDLRYGGRRIYYFGGSGSKWVLVDGYWSQLN